MNSNKVAYMQNKGVYEELTVATDLSHSNSIDKWLFVSHSLILGSSETKIGDCLRNLKSNLSFVKFFNDFFLFFVDITNTHELNLPLSTEKFFSYLLNDS